MSHNLSFFARHITNASRISVIPFLIICLSGFDTDAGASGEASIGKEVALTESGTASIGARDTAAFSIVDSMFVIHFHPDIQCSCCINVGEFSNESLETRYSDVCKEGKLSYREYNVDDDSYLETSYEVSDAALAFEAFTVRGREFKVIESVWDHCEDRDRFMAKFQEELDNFVQELAVADSVSEALDRERTLPEKTLGIIRQLRMWRSE
jgi:hypothetical protein